MFCKGDTIIYPIHGIGQITEIEEITFDGEKRSYYKINFPEKSLSISIPQQSAEDRGIRKPLCKKELKQKIGILLEENNLSDTNYSEINDKSQELLNTGLTEDAVTIIRLITSFKKQRIKEGKMLTTSGRNYLQKAKGFLKQEVELVLGEQAVKAYSLD